MGELVQNDQLIIEKQISGEIGSATWTELVDYEFNNDHYYRVVSVRGYKDFLDTGMVRSSPTGTEIDHRPTAYPTFC